MKSGRLLAANSLLVFSVVLNLVPSSMGQDHKTVAHEREPAPVVLVIAGKKTDMDVNSVLRVAVRGFIDQGLLRAKKNADISLSRDSQAWREYLAWSALSENTSDHELIPSGIAQAVILDVPQNDGVVVALFSRESSNVSFACVVDRKKNSLIRTEASGEFWSGFLRPLNEANPRGLREWVRP